MELDQSTSISKFYAGRSIFVTGSTGFMGKVLIEKLLRSCPDIQEIFLLMRPKKGMSIDDRLRNILTLPLFDKLREENPEAFKKLIPVTGNVADEGLGLPDVERRFLIERVSVIFHVAACVRFDDFFKDSVLLNTRGTREVCILAASMKKLVVLLHVSTTYGNTDRPVIDEKLYPPHADWKKTIKIAETVDENILNILTAKYLGKLPNTYTFTKQLAEHVINDYAGIIPSVIFRPSVVVSSISDPVSGWLDNFNGPIGLLVGGGKGILRTVYGNPDAVTDYIPVDVVIKTMIVSAWQRGIKTITEDPSIPVYNCASNGLKSVTTEVMINLALEISKEIPMDGILWVPNTTIGDVKSIFYINFLFFHLLPALVIDSVLKLSGAKPRLIKLQRKIYTANLALEFFLTRNWQFLNTKLIYLLSIIPESDQAEFGFDLTTMDIMTYFRNSTVGVKKYLLKEDMNKLDEAKALYNKMWWIDRALKVWFIIFLLWIAFSLNLITNISNYVTSIFDIA